METPTQERFESVVGQMSKEKKELHTIAADFQVLSPDRIRSAVNRIELKNKSLEQISKELSGVLQVITVHYKKLRDKYVKEFPGPNEKRIFLGRMQALLMTSITAFRSRTGDKLSQLQNSQLEKREKIRALFRENYKSFAGGKYPEITDPDSVNTNKDNRPLPSPIKTREKVLPQPSTLFSFNFSGRELTQKELLSHIKANEVKDVNNKGITISSIYEHNPQIDPGKSALNPLMKKHVLKIQDALDYTLQIENSSRKEEQEIGLFLTTTYKSLLKKEGKDITHLSPKDAAILACKVTMQHLEYSHLQSGSYSLEMWPAQLLDTFSPVVLGEYLHSKNDSRSVSSLLKPGYLQTKIDGLFGNGVCRNYAEATVVVFNAIKRLQDSKTTLLGSSFMVETIDGNFKGGSIKINAPILSQEGVEWHAWNSLYSIDKQGNTHISIVDPTFADTSGRLDYSGERFLQNLSMMHSDGVITAEQYILFLEKVIKTKERLSFGLQLALKYKLALLYTSQKRNKALTKSFLKGELDSPTSYLIKDRVTLAESYLTNFPDKDMEVAFYKYLKKVDGGTIASQVERVQGQILPLKEKITLVKKMLKKF